MGLFVCLQKNTVIVIRPETSWLVSRNVVIGAEKRFGGCLETLVLKGSQCSILFQDFYIYTKLTFSHISKIKYQEKT